VSAGTSSRPLLADSAFRRLLWTRLTSQIGDGWFQAGLAGSVLFNPDRQTGAIAIAAGFAILLLPYSLLGPFVGVFLDRWSRRNVLVTANLLRAALVVAIAALIWAGDEVLFAVLALAVIGINRFVMAGLSAALPHVTPSERLVTGNALANTLGAVCYSLALGSSALLQYLAGTGNHGYALITLTGVLGYAGAAAIARLSFARAALGPEPGPRRDLQLGREIITVVKGMVAGARHLGERPAAAYAIGAQAAHRFLYGVLALSTLLLYRNYFNDGEDYSSSIAGLGQIVVVGGVGILLAAAITPAATRRVGGRAWVTLLLAALAPTVIGCGLPYQQSLLLMAVFVINVAAQGTKIVVEATIQQECDDDFRGRVFSLNDTAYNLCYVAGLFAGALAVPADGYSPPTVVAIGIGYGLAALGFWRLTGHSRRYADRDPLPA